MNQREQVAGYPTYNYCVHYCYKPLLTLFTHSRIFSTLNMEAICSSETSVNTITTRHHFPENATLQIKDNLEKTPNISSKPNISTYHTENKVRSHALE
jgi:hypothetical protein